MGVDRREAEKGEWGERDAKEEAKKGEPKASLTDPDARRMRFADGSVKAGYNVQLAASATGMVVSVMATDRRNDAGMAVPMVDDIKRRYGRVPKRLLVDTNCAPAEDIVALASREGEGVLVYAPPPEERADVKPETLKRRASERAKEAPALKDWRQRMDTAQG